jgi:hypothetical protein
VNFRSYRDETDITRHSRFVDRPEETQAALDHAGVIVSG